MANPIAGQLTALQEQAERKREQRITAIEMAIHDKLDVIERAWQDIADLLRESHDDQLWAVSGQWNKWEDWLDHIDISRSRGFDLVAIAKSPHADLLKRLGVSRARFVLPLVKGKTREEAEGIIHEAQSQPTYHTGREAVHGENPFQYDEIQTPCPSCGTMLLASRAVQLREMPAAARKGNLNGKRQTNGLQRVAGAAGS